MSENYSEFSNLMDWKIKVIQSNLEQIQRFFLTIPSLFFLIFLMNK